MAEATPNIIQNHVIETASGRKITLRCPVCDHDQFIEASHPNGSDDAGYNHVIAGVAKDGTGHFQIVRFFGCNDCGFVMNFLPAYEKKEGGTE